MEYLHKGMLLQLRNGTFEYVKCADSSIVKTITKDGITRCYSRDDNLSIEAIYDAYNHNDIFNLANKVEIYRDGKWRNSFRVKISFNGNVFIFHKLHHDSEYNVIVENGKLMRQFNTSGNLPKKGNINNIMDFIQYIGGGEDVYETLDRFGSIWSELFTEDNGYYFHAIYD